MAGWQRLRPHCFALVSLIGVAVFTADATASPHLPVPSPGLFEALVTSNPDALTDDRWQCAADADDDCGCVTWSHPGGHVALSGVQPTPQGLVADRFLVSSADQLLIGDNLKVSADDEEPLTLHWDNAQITTTLDDPTALVAESASFVHPAQGSADVRLDAVRWYPAELSQKLAELPCEALSESPVATEASPRATAETLNFQQGWEAKGLRIGDSPPIPAGRADVAAGQRTGGFLPPAVSAVPDHTRLTASFHPGTIPLSLRAHATIEPGGGAGVGVWTTPPGCSDQSCAPRPMHLDAYGDISGSAALRLAGQAGVGDEHRHIVADVGGVQITGGDANPGAAERLDDAAFFRRWDSQRFAASASGPGHDLTVGAALFHDDRDGFAPGTEQPHAGDLWLHYGTRLDLGEEFTADVRMNHREYGATATTPGRLSSAMVGVERTWGSTRRMWVRPTVVGVADMGMATTDDGAVAGSSTRLDAVVDAGMAFSGRLLGQTHRISPRLFAGRRTAGLDRIPDEVHDSGFYDVTGYQLGTHHLLGAHLDQRLDLGERTVLELPAGLAVVDDARGANWQAIPHASLHLRSNNWSVSTSALCVDSCRTPGAQAQLRLRYSSRLESFHIVGDALHHRPGAPSPDMRIRTGFTDGFAPFDRASEPRQSWLHTSMLRLQGVNWRGALKLFGPPTTPAEGGAGVSVSRFWQEFGWGVGAQLAAIPAERDWALSAGFTVSPAF